MMMIKERASKLPVKKALAAFFLLGSSGAHADLLEYQYTDTNGEEKTSSYAEKYINPTGDITFALNAGIDRKVRISILNEKDRVVSTATSSLLGANDRITVKGKEHYGALLTLKPPSEEGNYSLKAEMLSSSGSVVKSSLHPIVVDRTKPVITGSPVLKKTSGWTAITKDVFGGGGLAYLSIGGISDEVGVAETYFVSQLNGSDKEIKSKVEFDKGTAKRTGNMPANWFEESKGNYNVGFRVFDKAGNYSEVIWPAFIDTTSASEYVDQWEVMAVRKTSSDPWQPYTSNMKAPSNPFQVAWGFKDSLIAGVNGTVDGLVSSRVHRSMQRIPDVPGYMLYIDTLKDFNGAGYTDIPKKAGGAKRISRNTIASKFNFSGLPTAPKPKGLSYKLKGSDKWINGFSKWIVTNSPKTITAIRGTVEAKDYPQRFSVSGVASCLIPAGSTSCESSANKTLATTAKGYVFHYIVASDSTGKLGGTHQGYLYTRWDTVPLILSDISMEDRDISFRLTDTEACDTSKCYWGPSVAWVKLESVTTDEKKQYNHSSLSRIDAKNWIAKFDSSKFAEGDWDIYVGGRDRFGNITEQLFKSGSMIDQTAPELDITLPEEGTISSLDEIVVLLSDDKDPEPKVTSIGLTGGPANDKIQLSWRKESTGVFRLEYPLLFPSLKAGESYTLVVSAEDEQQNSVEKSVSFEYIPEFVTLKNGMDGNLYIPNIQQPITREDGSNIIKTEPFTLSDGSLVTGSYDVYATLRSDADYPMVINGVEIQPGETTSVLDQHNFASSDGRLSIPMYASNDTIGQANVMISTAAPNSPILLLDVKTWKAEGKLSAESWEVRQVVDNLHILASPAPGTICRFTSDRKQAEAADPLKDPTCYIEWISIPDESEEQMITLDGLRVAGIVGQAMSLGEQPIRYRLSMFSGSNKIYLGEGERMLKVLPAEGSIAVSPPASSLKAHRTIGDVSIPFVQDKGPECSLTLDANVALREAQNRPFTSKSRTCLFEYQNIPDGLVQSIRSNEPLLTGTQDINGDSDIGWRISMYARSGSRISLNTQEAKLNIVDPSAPEIEVESKYHLRDNVYVVPFQESPTWLGDANVSGVSANIDVGLYRDDELLEEDTYSGGYGDRTSIDRPLDALPQSVWNKQVFSVLANFSDLPEIKSEKSIEVFTAPSLSVAPVISSKEDAAINSALLPVTVSIHDSRKRNDSYEPNYGNWEVRVLSEERYGKNRPLSDWQVTDFNGEAGFEVPLHDVDSNRVRLVAEARLLSEVEGYERTEFSRRPMTMQLLRGNSIESSVVSRRLSGPAPFSTVFKVDLEERLDLRALDTVTWYLSDDGGSTWVEQNLSSRSDMVFVKNFEEGKYQIKAKTRNANSGAEKFTEIVEVVAFPMAEFDIEGPLSLYPDDTGNYTLNGLVGDVEITEENSEIEWSLDGGKNYTVFGPTVSLTQSHTGNVRLAARVRSKMAPGESRASWEMARVSVSFRRIRPPKLRIVGPSRVESGVEYEYAANISAPYRGINYPINGYWILPDGEKVEGFNLKYTPTSDDALRGSVNLQYVAWVEGYRERGAETSAKRRSRVWQYKWPNFSIGARQSASVAPADVVVSVRKVAHRGALEEPVYTWTFPEGIQPLDARNPTIRKVNIKEEGVYPVTVEITDARGNKTTLTEEVTLGAFDPFELTLDPRASNEYYRAPLSVYIRPRVDAGHPRDRIENYRYFVNGEEVLQERKSSSTRLTLDEGTHKVKLVAETKMGFSSEVTEEIVVKANKNPVCNLETRDRSNGWSVTADCNDEDGRVRGFEWSLSDGTEQASGSRRMGLTKWNYPDGVTVTVVAVDDAEGRSTPVSVVLKPEVEEPEEM